MNAAALKTEIALRIQSASAFAALVGQLESDPALSAWAATARTGKGLICVQLYAIYEYSLVKVIQEGIAALNAFAIPLKEIRHECLALALDAECKSLADVGPKKVWENRLALFSSARGATVSVISDSMFPFDGSHMRAAQLRTIWTLFGISEPIVPESKMMGWIDEMVEHRNAVAHGRETPEVVGGRYTIGELKRRVADTEQLCLYIVDTIERHFSDEKSFR